ncbi:MAG: hypothetical protein HUJ58_00385, partial [Erysipelotrichaceae bacterium]|nr:hypothetical protein [Erysipelotrichaceae bacterium]
MHNNITQHFPQMEELLARCDDWVEQSQRWYRPVCSDFLTRFEQECVSRYLGNQYEYRFIPETVGCERKCVMMGDAEEQPVVLLHGTYSRQFLKLTHRDLKGALLQSGIKEDQFGDLWVEDG